MKRVSLLIICLFSLNLVSGAPTINITTSLIEMGNNYKLSVTSTISDDNDSVNIPLVINLLHENGSLWYSAVEITDQNSRIQLEINIPEHMEDQRIYVQVSGPSIEVYSTRSRSVLIPIHPSNIVIPTIDPTIDPTTGVITDPATNPSQSNPINQTDKPSELNGIPFLILFLLFTFVVLIIAFERGTRNESNNQLIVKYTNIKSKTSRSIANIVRSESRISQIIKRLILFPVIIVAKIFQFLELLEMIYNDIIKENISAKSKGFKTINDYKKSQRLGFTDSTNYYNAINNGFTDLTTYQKAMSLGYKDNLTYQNGTQSGFENYSEFAIATGLGFTKVDDYHKANNYQIPNYEVYKEVITDIKNGNFPNFIEFKKASNLGYSTHSDFTKGEAAGFENADQFQNASSAGFSTLDEYNLAIENGFNNFEDFSNARRLGILDYATYSSVLPTIELYGYPTYKIYLDVHDDLKIGNFSNYPNYKRALSFGFHYNEDYMAANKGGFKKYEDYSIAKNGGFKNFKEYQKAQKLGLSTFEEYRSHQYELDKIINSKLKIEKFIRRMESNTEVDLSRMARSLKIKIEVVRELLPQIIEKEKFIGVRLMNDILVKEISFDDLGIITKTKLSYPIGVCPYCEAKEKYGIFVTALDKKSQCPSCKNSLTKINLIRSENKQIRSKKRSRDDRGMISKKALYGEIAEHKPCGGKDVKKIFLEYLKIKNCPKCGKKVVNINEDMDFYKLV